MIHKFLAVLACAAVVCACASRPSEPVVRTVEVRVPVPVSCVPETLRGPKPYPSKDDLRRAPGAADRLQIAVAAYLLMDQRLRELEPVIAGCRSGP